MSLNQFMIKFLTTIALLFSIPAFSQVWKEHYLVKHCDIYKFNTEKVKAYPGLLCHFFEDGSFLSAAKLELNYFSKNKEILWKIPGEYHHQLNLSEDGKRILVLSSKNVTDDKGKKIGIDHFMIINKFGKIIHESLADWLYKTLKDSPPWSNEELTHFNSFYEIPKLVEKGLPDYMQEGNILLNGYGMGLFILSPDLKKILHHRKFSISDNHKVHDVKVLPNGHFIFFNNLDSRSTEQNRFSSVIEMDHKERIVHQFPKTLDPTFFSLHMGGVQVLDQEHWLISHAVVGSYIYSKKSRKIIYNLYQTHFERHRFLSAQQVNLVDLKGFMNAQTP